MSPRLSQDRDRQFAVLDFWDKTHGRVAGMLGLHAENSQVRADILIVRYAPPLISAARARSPASAPATHVRAPRSPSPAPPPARPAPAAARGARSRLLARWSVPRGRFAWPWPSAPQASPFSWVNRVT